MAPAYTLRSPQVVASSYSGTAKGQSASGSAQGRDGRTPNHRCAGRRGGEQAVAKESVAGGLAGGARHRAASGEVYVAQINLPQAGQDRDAHELGLDVGDQLRNGVVVLLGNDAGKAGRRSGLQHSAAPAGHRLRRPPHAATPLEGLRQRAVDREVRDTDPTARRQHAVHLGCRLGLAREGAEGTLADHCREAASVERAATPHRRPRKRFGQRHRPLPPPRSPARSV